MHTQDSSKQCPAEVSAALRAPGGSTSPPGSCPDRGCFGFHAFVCAFPYGLLRCSGREVCRQHKGGGEVVDKRCLLCRLLLSYL